MNIKLHKTPIIEQLAKPGFIIEASPGSRITKVGKYRVNNARNTALFGYVCGLVINLYDDDIRDSDSEAISSGHIAVEIINSLRIHQVSRLESWLDGDQAFKSHFEEGRPYTGPLIVLGQVFVGGARGKLDWLSKNGLKLEDQEKEELRVEMLEYDYYRPKDLVLETPGGKYDFAQVKFVPREK